VHQLSTGRQQLVEIAKALSLDARVLIMDEPTSSLSLHETERLFQVVRDLRRQGVSIVYISHRLGEVRALADRVLVLRDGCNSGELARGEASHDAMVRLMVGREVSGLSERRSHGGGPPALTVRELRTPAHPGHAATFTVHQGEMVGIAGLVGAGRTELLRVLFGVDRAVGGEVSLLGSPVRITDPRAAIRHGLALVPEDRKQQGLFLAMAVRENLSMASLDLHSRGGFLRRASERRAAQVLVATLGIATADIEQSVAHLSGGNQQKVVLARWLALRPRVLLLDEPTRGVDVGARQEIYRLMEGLAADGVAILFASSEMEEILYLADRCLVMHQGRIRGELPRQALSEAAIMQLATGGAGVDGEASTTP
jgi:ribose transport system ATP-binding protein